MRQRGSRLARRLRRAPWSAAALAGSLGLFAFVLSGFVGTEPAHAIFGIDVGDVVNEAIEGLLGLLFKDIPEKVSVDLVGWLVRLDNPLAADHRRLLRVEQTMAAAAWGLLGLLVTLAVFRYWLAGLSGRGGFEALQGLWRGVGAAAGLVLWPYLFSNAVLLVNHLTHGLLSASSRRNTAALIADALGQADGASFFIVTLVAALVGVLLSIALFCMKVMLTASLDVVFAIGPLAIVLWVLPEMAWLARFVSRVFVALLVWPIVWIVCFAVFGAIGVESLTPDGAGEALVKPFVAIALLFLCLKLPFAVLDATSLIDGAGGGFVSGTARYVAGRTLYDRISAGRRDGGQAATGIAGGGPGGRGGGGGGLAGPRGGGGGGRPGGGGGDRSGGGGLPPTGASPGRERSGGRTLVPELAPGLAATAAAIAAEPVAGRVGAASALEGEQRGGGAKPHSAPARPHGASAGAGPLPQARPGRPGSAPEAGRDNRRSSGAVEPPPPMPADRPPVRAGDGQLDSAAPPAPMYEPAPAALPFSGDAPATPATTLPRSLVEPAKDASGRSPAARPPQATPAASVPRARPHARLDKPPGAPPLERRQPAFLA